MSKFVLDCSVALAWFFPDESSGYADSVMERLDSRRAIAPSIWTLEFLNALLYAERRGRITETDTHSFVSDIAEVEIESGPGSAIDSAQLLRLAREHDLSAYDAAYLELAMRRRLPLATLDEKLRAAAARVGVSLFEP